MPYKPDHSPIICSKCGNPRSGPLNLLGHLDDHRVCAAPKAEDDYPT
jgi:hypothetical protein